MWDQIPKHKLAIQRGLQIRKIKNYFEIFLGIALVLCAVFLSLDSEGLISLFLPISATGFFMHLFLQRELGYFKACRFYGLSGHESESLIMARLNGEPLSELAYWFWMIEKR